MQTYENLLGELNKHQVAYIVVGGMAVAFNGYLRTTEDVDILVDAAPENIVRLLRALANFGEGSARELCVEDFTKEEGAIRVVEDFPVDIFTVMQGIDYAEAAKTQKFHPHPSGGIPYLSIEMLQRLKGGSLREKDQLDVRALEEMKSSPAP